MENKDTAAKRTCLCCGKQFKSSWIGNRICSRCSASPKFAENGSSSKVITSDRLKRYR